MHQRTIIPSLPARLGRFELLRVLGSGSSGTVYDAADPDTGQHVALKLLDRVDRARLDGLRAEYRVMGALPHPNVVTPYELVEADGAWFIVMERVSGEGVVAWIRSGFVEDRFPHRLVGAMTQLVEAVEYLHRQGVVHLDLKPANVLVRPTGEVVVLDFGLAGYSRPGTALGGPAPATFAGTPPYAAPEQFEGHPGPASDWFAVGVLLYEALTGERPRDAQEAVLGCARLGTLHGGWGTPLFELLPFLFDADPAMRGSGADLRKALAATGVVWARPAESTQSEVEARLNGSARRVLDCLVLGARPLPRDAFGTAAPQRDALRDLFRHQLITRAWQDGREHLEATDAGKAWVQHHLAPEQRAAAHVHVAATLEELGAPVEEVARHRVAGGDLAGAERMLLAEAEGARRLDAPGRAADLYGIVTDTCRPGGDRGAAIARLRADCLLRAGRSLEAAEVYEGIAAGLPPDVSRAWNARAVGAWLQGGEIRRGGALLAVTLGLEGLRRPQRGARAAASILLSLARLAIPWSIVVRSTIVRDAAQVDLLWTGGRGLVAVVPEMGLELMLRSALMARRMGDGGRYARVIAFLCMFFFQFRILDGVARRALATAERIALETEDPRLSGAIALWRAGAHVYAADWERLETEAREAAAQLARHDDMCWEHALAVGFVAWALQLRGSYRSSGEIAALALASASREGDRYAQVLFAQYAAFAALAQGDLPAARSHCANVVHWDTGSYTLADFYGMFLEAHCDLYEGRMDAALGRMEADGPPWRAAGGHRIALWRMDQAVLQARIVICCPRMPAREGRLGKLARLLRREARPDGAAQAAWIEGARSLAVGAEDAAMQHLGRAAAAFDALGMVGNALCIRLVAARRRGDTAAAERSREQLRERGVAAPDRWADLLTPLGADEARPPS